ncbi:MAG: RNA polymerase sigma factor [bacterium]
MDLTKEIQLDELAKIDSTAIAKLYDEYYDKIFNYIYRRCGDIHIAEDVVADTFVSIIKNIKKFEYRYEIGLSAWIYKIATNSLNIF